MHILNSCLLALIVGQLAPVRRIFTGVSSGLLFLLFPFGFQAVTPVNSLMHPLHTSMILAAVWLYLISASPTRWLLRALSVLIGGASILAHENGALAAALITLVAVTTQPRKPVRQMLLNLAPYWIATAVFILVWRAAPRTGDPLAFSGLFSGWESRLQNTVYFLQAFTSPVSALAPPLRNLLPLTNDLIILLLISLPVCIAWSCWHGVANRDDWHSLARLGLRWRHCQPF